jgi:peptidyl-prolyl cis-trans isomerase D
MFDYVSRHKRLMQIFLAIVIVPTFAFFGIQSYDRVFSSGDAVAEVAGQKITVPEFNRALDQQRDTLRGMLGKAYDPALLDSLPARKELLEGLIGQRAVLTYAQRNRMLVPDDLLQAAIATEPVFQEDGKFSRARYQALLRGQNMSEQQFEAQMRADMLMRQLGSGLVESGFASRSVAQRIATNRTQAREISELVFPAVQYARQVKLAPDAVEAYYKANPKLFESPEQVRAEYVVLSPEVLIAAESVAPDEVRQWYETNVAPRAKQRAEARGKIDAIAAELRKDPARFAELAKANSQDPGSAQQGGDLGWFGRGAMVKPFDDAVFRLKEGETSAIVETEFGFHIVRVTGTRKPGQDGAKAEERRASHILINAPKAEKDFATARPEIENELKRARVSKRFAELADAFSNLAYEQPDSLQPLAERYKLKIETSGWITRQAAPPPLDNAKLLAALFADDAVKNKRNTEAVETAPTRIVVARVAEHRPATVRPLETVRADIARRLTEDEALRLARAAGAARLEELQSGKTPTLRWGQARSLSREALGGLDPRAVGPVFRADASKLPSYVGVDLPPTGYTIYRISKVGDAGVADAAKLRAAETALARQESRMAYQAFLNGLKARSDVTINEANLVKKER